MDSANRTVAYPPGRSVCGGERLPPQQLGTLHYTTDYGRKWTRIIDASDVNGHVLCVQTPWSPACYLPVPNGLYVSFDYGKLNHWTHDYPNVSTMDLKITRVSTT